MTLDAASCYRALASRDARFDGRFFTGVTTTGIYCRPICPARTPSRANVRFYPCATAAEADGFRPCRRCRPDAAPGTPAWQGAPTTVARGLRLIRDGALDEDSIDRFAARLGLSARHVRRLFETHLGAAPTDIARTRRVHFARTLLDDPSMRLTDIAFASGFQSVRQFNHAFRQTFNSAPRTLRGRTLKGRPTIEGRATSSITLRLGFRPPLDFDWLVRLLAGRAAPGVERVDGGVYRRTVAAGDAAGWIEIARPEGLRHRPEGPRRSDSGYLQVRSSASLASQLMRVAAGVRRLFDLDADPATIQRALSADARLAAAIRTAPGLRVPGAWQPWEIALRAIAGQQVSVAAASTIVGRIVERAGKKVDTPFDGLSHLFPPPDAVAAVDLSNIGMPSARTATVKRFAAGLADGSIRLEITGSSEQTIRALCSIQGIGPWTAEYIALRALGEPDAFPAGDLGLRKALGNGAPASEREAAKAAEAWRPWRGYAAMYLWSAKTQEASMERVRIASPVGELTCLVREDVLVGVAFNGDSGGTLDYVRKRFPGEKLMNADEAGGVRAAFEKYFAGDTAALDTLAVDPGGTPFQNKVWMSLREITAGQTWSYQDLARRIGAPAAMRAVGAANGANPIPLVLPCHRVIGKNRKLVGYGGGLARKEWLLRHEGWELASHS